jgi:hypothetical protein
MRICPKKEITFYVFLGENRDPSEIYANSNLRNLTHITQKPSHVYTLFTYTLKEITGAAVHHHRPPGEAVDDAASAWFVRITVGGAW